MKTLFTICLLVLSACGAHIKVKDTIAYGDKGKFGSTGVHTLCDLIKCPPILLDKTEWDAKRIGMICVAGDWFADMQANIDKLCARSPKTCDYEEVKVGRAALRRVNKMRKATLAHPELRSSVDFMKVMEQAQ